MHRTSTTIVYTVLNAIDVNCDLLPTAVKRSLNRAERSRRAHVPMTGR